MKKTAIITLTILALLTLGAGPAFASDWTSEDDVAYREAIQRTAGMVWDEQAQHLAAAHGLHAVNVTWEDTGRYYGSAVGPNISDMTIQVSLSRPKDRGIRTHVDARHPLSQLFRSDGRHLTGAVFPHGRQ